MRRLALALVLTLVASPGHSQSLEALQYAHISANVPPSDQFDRILRRDLLAYFQAQVPDTVAVDYVLLRDAPTQSGVAYPKFYLWVVATDHSGQTQEGAARVAAIYQVQFQITDFLSRSEILFQPSRVVSTFPASLNEAILNKAAGR